MACFTIVYITYRPGGIDLLAESLKYQPSYLYELVVIDDWPGRVERGIAQQYLIDKGIPLRYYGKSDIGDNPSGGGAVRAMNKGALWSRLKWTIFVQDFAWFPPGAIVQWSKIVTKYALNSIISGVGCVHEAEPPTCYTDVSIWKEPYPESIGNIHEEQHEWVPRVFEAFYFCAPTFFIDLINGFDESIEWSFTASIVYQATCHGIEAIVDPTIRIDILNHRNWVDDTNRNLWLCKRIREYKVPNLNLRSPNPYDFPILREEYINKPSIVEII